MGQFNSTQNTGINVSYYLDQHSGFLRLTPDETESAKSSGFLRLTPDETESAKSSGFLRLTPDETESAKS